MHGRGRRDENGRDIIRWCFADPASAAAFTRSLAPANGGALAANAAVILKARKSFSA